MTVKGYLNPGFGGLPGKGPIPCDYMLVGMAPSTRRPSTRKGEPFGASSWKVLNKILKFAGEEVYVTNLVKHPVRPGKKLRKADIRQWWGALVHEFQIVQPKRVIAMGAQVAAELCPNYVNLIEDHGTFFWSERFNCYILPSYHFSAASRNPDIYKWLINDFRRFFTLPDPEPPPWELVPSIQDIRFTPGEPVFLDLEGTGVEMGSAITMIGLRHSGVNYIVENFTPEELSRMGAIFAEEGIEVIGQNLPYDLMMLKVNSRPFGFPTIKVKDTMLMAHTAGEPKLSLKHLTTAYTDRPGSRAFGGFQDYGYLAEDILSTEAVYNVFRDVEDRFITKLVNELVPYVAQMRVHGVYIDQSKLGTVEAIAQEQRERALRPLWERGGRGVNWNSPQQVVKFLIAQGVKLRKKTKTGNYSVAEDVLLDLQERTGHPVIDALLLYREANKELEFVSSYREFLKWDGYLHPRLLLQGTITGRLSCRDPNLQQVKRKGPIKTLFVSRWDKSGGKIGLVDLSQAELRVAALLSGDTTLIESLLSEDAHRANASVVFEKPPEEITATERKYSKKTTFGVLYGGSARGLAARNNLEVYLVEKVVKAMKARFPTLMRWIDEIQQEALSQLELTSLFGRTRRFEALLKDEGPGGVKRKAVNTPIQSVASDCGLVILRGIWRRINARGLLSLPLFPVHDSNLIDIYPGEEEEVAHICQLAFTDLWDSPVGDLPLFKELPLVGELVIGASWAAVESTNEDNYNPESEYLCSSADIAEPIGFQI